MRWKHGASAPQTHFADRDAVEFRPTTSATQPSAPVIRANIEISAMAETTDQNTRPGDRIMASPQRAGRRDTGNKRT